MDERWQELLAEPDWYLDPRAEELWADRADDGRRDRFVAALEAALEGGTVALGTAGREWDRERRTIDRVVIHHTSRAPGISARRLSALGLLRLYAAYYASPTPRFAEIRGTPIHSGHVRDGRQVFFAYHWIIREDGSAERLLRDEEIGWHAGDWTVNCRSVAVAFDGDFDLRPPGPDMIDGARELILTRYGSVPAAGVLGHREVRPVPTSCPGGAFLGPSGWKRNLLRALEG